MGHAPPNGALLQLQSLDLYLIETEIDREHLTMTNICMKFEKTGPNQTLVIVQTRLYTMDGCTDGQTDAQQYTPSS